MRNLNLTAAQFKELVATRDRLRVQNSALARELYESDIEKAIVGAMVLDGWREFKMQYSWDQIKKITLGEPGMADHLFLRPRPILRLRPVFEDMELPPGFIQGLWWEFKASKKRRKRKEMLSPDQVLWSDREQALGFLVWHAGIDHPATIAGAAQHYLDSGLARRREVFTALLPREARP